MSLALLVGLITAAGAAVISCADRAGVDRFLYGGSALYAEGAYDKL